MKPDKNQLSDNIDWDNVPEFKGPVVGNRLRSLLSLGRKPVQKINKLSVVQIRLEINNGKED